MPPTSARPLRWARRALLVSLPLLPHCSTSPQTGAEPLEATALDASTPDAAPDAAPPDAAPPDAAPPDAAPPDATSPLDAGADAIADGSTWPEASTPDSGAAEAGPADASVDAAGCTTDWTLTEYYNGHVIHGLATDGKTYVAVGECASKTAGVDCGAPTAYGGLVMTSSGPLTDWTVGQSQVMLSLKDVIYAAGRFVAVGNKKHITTSEDGFTWTLRLSGTPTDSTLSSIVHDGKQFVVVGTGGVVCTSADGLTWSCEAIAGAKPEFTDLAHCGGRFVGVGASGAIATSTDAKAWTSKSVGAANLYAVACNGTRFVAGGAGGASWYSDDGTNWTPTSSKGTNYWMGATYIAPCGLFVAALDWGTGPSTSVLVSHDGVDWEQRFTGSTAKHALFGVLFDGSRAITYGAYSSVHVTACPCGM